MALISIAFLAVWVVFSLLGFWKLSDPGRQVLFSGTLLVIAAGVTLGVLRSVPLGAAVFGVGAIAALVRISRAWRHLPVNRPH